MSTPADSPRSPSADTNADTFVFETFEAPLEFAGAAVAPTTVVDGGSTVFDEHPSSVAPDAQPKELHTDRSDEVSMEASADSDEFISVCEPKPVPQDEEAVSDTDIAVDVARAIPVEQPAIVGPHSQTDTVDESDAQELSKEQQSAAGGHPGENDSSETTGFRALALREEVQQVIESAGYSQPTEIQQQIIPYVLEGRDVVAQSQTGTGKTAAFALPILSRVDITARAPRVLVLAPTRELAIQVAESFQTYGQRLPRLRVAAIYGGTGYDSQLRDLKRGVSVVVGTPGRVIDHLNRGTLKLDQIECVVLDEADEMLNMGFLDDVATILDKTPSSRQVALFSATLPQPIRRIAEQYLQDPVQISVKQKTMTAEAIRQRAVIVQHRDKLDVLSRLLEVEATDGVIVFTKTREATATVAEHLVQSGFSAVALNGDMPQKVRERTIAQLKSGRLDIVVATDVAARGLDVARISHVFNFDVPQDTESYIHRIGRTGRAGRSGEAIILLSNSQKYKLRHIERATRQRIEIVRSPDADDINAARITKFKQQITDVIAERDLQLFSSILTEYVQETGQAIETVAAALAELRQNGRSFFVQDRPQKQRQDRHRDDRPRNDRRSSREFRDSPGSRPDRSGDRRRAGRVESGMERFRIEVGQHDGVRPGNIVGAVANEAGIDGEYIGPIHIYDDYATIDLPDGMPKDVFDTLQDVRVAGKALRLRRATEQDNHGQRSDQNGSRRNGRKGSRKELGGKGFRAQSKRRPGKKRRDRNAS